MTLRPLADVVADFTAGRITGPLLQEAAEHGLWKPTAHHVLLKAIHAIDGEVASGVAGSESIILATAREAGKMKLDARDAVCFRVLAVGEGVAGIEPGDLVQQTSASGDVVDHTDESCRYWLIHEEDVTAVIRLPA